MKTDLMRTSALATSILVASQACFCQGTFQNLDFESAVIVPIPGDPYDRIQFASAFPGWTGYVGTNAQTAALYNNMFLDSAGLGLQGVAFGQAIDGAYSAMLEAGFALSGPPDRLSASLGQIGLVPSDARSLQFRVEANGAFAVALNGQTLSLTPVSIGPNYVLYGANITSFAGTPCALTFTAFPNPGNPAVNPLFLDSIAFSSETVPEPSAWGLLSCAAAILAVSRWRRAK